MTSYIAVALYLVNIAFWKLWKRTKRVGFEDMDLSTGRLEDDGREYPSTLTTLFRWVVRWVRRE